MSLSVADPGEQFRFAAYLHEVSAFLGKRRLQLQQSCLEAAVICRDAKYEEFGRSMDRAMEACLEYERLIERFAGELERKAKCGDRYLDVAGGSRGSVRTQGGAGVRATPEAIKGFEMLLDGFARAHREGPGAIFKSVQARISRLEGRREEVENRLDTLRGEASEARAEADDEDGYGSANDVESTEHAIEEEEERLRKIDNALVRLGDAATAFDRQRNALEELLGPETEKARLFLREAGERLRSYESVRVGGGGSAFPAPALAERVAASGQPPERMASPMEAVALPPGFAWIPIGAIDLDRELVEVQGPQDYRKTSSPEIFLELLGRFRALILPELSAGTPREDLIRRDLDARVYDTTGLSGAYDFFLGSDPIHLDGKSAGGGYRVTDGRHRIRAALDAGWTHVPATLGGKTKQT